MRIPRRLLVTDEGMSTIEYIIGAAVVLGTLIVGVNSWNAGLVSKLQNLVNQLNAVH